MTGSVNGPWRVVGVAVVAVAFALGLSGTLFAQTAPAPSQGMVAVVTDPDGLNLRAGPGTQYPSLAVIPAGSALPILGERVETNWLPVSYEGLRGFVHDAYVQIRATTDPASPAPTASPSPAPAGTSAPTASPSATPAPSPSPTPSPLPTPRPVGPPPSPIFDNGVLLQGVYASDWDEMITVADEFNIVALVRAPAGVTRMTMRLSGAPFLRASASFDLQPGDNWLQIPTFRVDTENEPVLREEIIRKVGGSIPIQNGALVMALDFTDEGGAARTASFEPIVHEFNNPGRVARVEYPDLKRLTGMPPGSAVEDSYYLRGDLDFHHPDDFYVRKLSIEAGRRGGVFSDDPELVADNVFTYINALLGDAEPGDFNNDYNLARLIEEGTIVRGRSNGGYICIAQTYFMTALTRTLGLPSRELNIAVGRANWQGNDGVWRVTWWQEGAIHTWYNGQWNHYDLWLGFKGMNGYFQANLAYQTWAAFNRQAVPFVTINGLSTGLRGHDFNAFPGDQPQWDFVREATKPGVVVLGMPDQNGEPVTRRPDFSDYQVTDATSRANGPAVETARPPASLGILNPPETRP